MRPAGAVCHRPRPTSWGAIRAVGEIRAMLDQTHVLTLVGAGGIGKTSLAIEAARHAAPDFPEPVCLVELATLNTHEAVLAAIVEGCETAHVWPAARY